ncbi:hypothetical protein FHG87_002327 [Trinorchestia longiramus]|nr:hypothetical protein FHG87_002327 [Trinorchestia longiramus]
MDDEVLLQFTQNDNPSKYCGDHYKSSAVDALSCTQSGQKDSALKVETGATSQRNEEKESERKKVRSIH